MIKELLVNEMSPLISIAMATYNGEKFLKQQLDSIYAQDYPNIEVVVRDDCSSDGTCNILDFYKKKYGLRYEINSENIGPNKNFEKVIKQCKGKYIALSDQDDVWLPHKLSYLKQSMDENDVWLVYSEYGYIDADGQEILINFNSRRTAEHCEIQTNYKSFYFANYIAGCSIMFHQNLISRLDDFPNIFHDWWIAYVATYSRGILSIPIHLFNRRKHIDSITLGNNKSSNYRKDIIHKHGWLRIFERDVLVNLEYFKNFESHFVPSVIVKGIDIKLLITYCSQGKLFRFLFNCRPSSEVFMVWSYYFYIYIYLCIFFPRFTRWIGRLGLIDILKKILIKYKF